MRLTNDQFESSAMNKMEEWTPEAAEAIELCKGWAAAVSASIPCDIHLFGSAIYRGGDQFDALSSDLDIVIVFHDDLDATGRVLRMVDLLKMKADLELQLIPGLRRTNCEEAAVSLVPLTRLELKANIHKSGVRHFFTRNFFLDLRSGELSVSLPNAAEETLPYDARQALEYAQKIRNQFLSISANNSGGLPDFAGTDPLPKPLARVAAQMIPEAEEGEWYDTRLGLEHLWNEVARRRTESELFVSLYRKLSVRRGGRGKKVALSSVDQLLLAEILHDLASVVSTEPVVTWEIRFGGPGVNDLDRGRLVSELMRLVPDAEVIGIFHGSIIIRLRSSKRSYETVQRLSQSRSLEVFFNVEKVDLLRFQEQNDAEMFESGSLIDRIANSVSKWRPRSEKINKNAEVELAVMLTQFLYEQGLRPDAVLVPEATVNIGNKTARVDFLLNFGIDDQFARIVVELVLLRSRENFFRQLELVLALGMPSILVVVGTSRQLDGLTGDINRLAQVNAQVRVVSVPIKADNN